jgi:hypothetical protein
MWLQRPPTALYWRRGWQVYFKREHRLVNFKNWCRRVVNDIVLNRFILRRGRHRWLAHWLIMWGTIIAAAITFPLLFGFHAFLLGHRDVVDSHAGDSRSLETLLQGIQVDV